MTAQPPKNSVIFWAIPLLALIFLIILAWLNTGTLSLYAATLNSPLISHCGYLLNIDHSHFESSFHLLHGTPGEHSTLLVRRILYPVLAYPAMLILNLWGNPEWFILGGFISSLVIYAFTVLVFWRAVNSYYGHKAAIFGLLLLITYPGIYYWIGSPYAYNWIVPGGVLAFLLLEYTYRAQGTRQHLLAALALGTIFLGYDLWVFFLPAAALLLIFLKRYRLLLPYLITACFPTIFYSIFLVLVLKINLGNSNSEVYLQTLNAYLTPAYYQNYFEVLKVLPRIFLNNFSYSNFLILPVMFLLLYFSQRLLADQRVARLALPELCVLLSASALFLFINLAPQSDVRWQMRGEWIARLYQPIFVVFIFYTLRLASCTATLTTTIILPAVLLNLLVVLSPILNIQTTNALFYNFYRHGSVNSPTDNWSLWGRRPLGYCLKKKRLRQIKHRLADLKSTN